MVIYIRRIVNRIKCPNCGEYSNIRLFKSTMINTIIGILLTVGCIALIPIIGWITIPILLLSSVLYFRLLLLIYVLFFESKLFILSIVVKCEKCGSEIILTNERNKKLKIDKISQTNSK